MTGNGSGGHAAGSEKWAVLGTMEDTGRVGKGFTIRLLHKGALHVNFSQIYHQSQNSVPKFITRRLDKSIFRPNTVYRPSGYRDKPAELGEDPLSTVRTLKNNLRRRALRYETQDLPVKAHLCQTAIDQLSHAEGELLALGRERSNAILVGDNSKTQGINRQMEAVKEKAVRNAYADLIMENDEMHAFGVDSKWTPDRQPRPPSPKYVRPKTPDDGGRFKPRSVPRFKERPKSEDRPRSTRRAASSSRARAGLNSGYNPIVKKNERLYPDGFPGQGGYDDPYDLPDYSGICQFCGQGGPKLGTKQGAEEHYSKDCMVMNRCRYCQKVLLVSDLTEHYIGKCSFLKKTMIACPKCGLAMDKIDKKDGVDHPLCRGRPPPSGTQWCPLCAVAVDNNREAWQKHLEENCYSNPRRMGIEEDPQPESEEEDVDDVDPRTGRRRRGGGGGGGGGGSGPGGGRAGRNGGYDGRMIDSNKLVKALQEIQDRKKAERANKKKPTEPAPPPPAATAPADPPATEAKK